MIRFKLATSVKVIQDTFKVKDKIRTSFSGSNSDRLQFSKPNLQVTNSLIMS